MDFTLPDTAPAVREGVAAVAAKYDHAYWSACDDEHRFPWEAWRDLAAGGWVGRLFRDARIGRNIPVPEELILAHIGTQVLGLPRSH